MLLNKKVITALSLWFLTSLSTGAGAAVSIGQKAPALVATDLAGDKVNLEDMKGKTVVVALWASSCELCYAEMRMLRDFYHKYEDRGVEVIALSLDRPRDKKVVQKIAATVDYHVPLAVEATRNGFDSTEAPLTTYVIDKEGTVSAIFDQKPVTEEELVRAALR